MDFFTWEVLLTLAGASAATGIIVQLLKENVPIVTQILSYAVALVVLLAATFFTGGRDPSAYALCLLNAGIVAGAASNTAAFIQKVKGR